MPRPSTVRALVLALSIAAAFPARATQSPRIWEASEVPMPEIEPGTLAPEAADGRVTDRIPHADVGGRALHVLLELEGREGAGFAAAWRDTRLANLALYFRRYDLEGAPVGEDRPFSIQGASFRELVPSISVDPTGGLALAWQTPRRHGDPWFRGRLMRPDGVFVGPEARLKVPRTRWKELGLLDAERRERTGRPATLEPAAARLPDGRGLFVWTFEGRVFVQDVSADHMRQGELRLLNRAAPLAEGPPLLDATADDDWIAVWNTAEGVACARRLHRRLPRARAIGGGRALRLLREGGESLERGWVLLVETPAGVALRRLDRLGAVLGEDVPLHAGAVGHADLAVWTPGLALLLHPDARMRREAPRGGPFEVRFFGPRGQPDERPSWRPQAPEADHAYGPRIAGAGGRLMVAWSERRGSSTDVYARFLGTEGEPGPEQRVNTDEASTDQSRCEVASDGAGRGVVVWLDARSGPGRVFARTLDERGAYSSPEIALPAAEGADPGGPAAGGAARDGRPVAAVAGDGSFAVAYPTERDPGWTLTVQVFDAGGRARSVPVDVEPEHGVDEAAGIELAARDGGWLLVWTRKGPTAPLRLGRLDPEGRALEVETLREGGVPSNPALTRLDDGRWILAWDERVAGGRRLAARFLDAQARPTGDPLGFEGMFRGHDWDPAVAPGDPDRPGSFVLAWCSGEGPDRDVVARVFDERGRPTCDPLGVTGLAHEQDWPDLARLADGTCVVAWEDDISYVDRVYVRRIDPSSGELGPIRMLSPHVRVHKPDFQAARVAPLGDGFLASWFDPRRERGFDVRTSVHGPAFDGAVEGPDPVGEGGR